MLIQLRLKRVKIRGRFEGEIFTSNPAKPEEVLYIREDSFFYNRQSLLLFQWEFQSWTSFFTIGF